MAISVLVVEDDRNIAELLQTNDSILEKVYPTKTVETEKEIPAFAYSSNGDAFYEHDMITGQERQIDLDKFPSPAELLMRFQTEKCITPAEMAAINQPYYSSQTTYSPRYYQRNAIFIGKITEIW